MRIAALPAQGRHVDQGRRRALLFGLAATVLGAVAGGLLTGCGGAAEPSTPPPVSGLPVATAVSPAVPAAQVDRPVRMASTPRAPHPLPEPLVALASADAARQTQAGPDEVRIVQVEAREWPDRSLGCPRPGLGYAQSITPGFLIVVEAHGRRLEYHTDHAEVVLCGT